MQGQSLITISRQKGQCPHFLLIVSSGSTCGNIQRIGSPLLFSLSFLQLMFTLRSKLLFCLHLGWLTTILCVSLPFSSHLLPPPHTPWLRPAPALTAAPTTAAVAAVALQAGNSSARPTSTSGAFPPQPQTTTWSSSVSREYPHFLLSLPAIDQVLICGDFSFRVQFLCTVSQCEWQ